MDAEPSPRKKISPRYTKKEKQSVRVKNENSSSKVGEASNRDESQRT